MEFLGAQFFSREVTNELSSSLYEGLEEEPAHLVSKMMAAV